MNNIKIDEYGIWSICLALCSLFIFGFGNGNLAFSTWSMVARSLCATFMVLGAIIPQIIKLENEGY